MMLRRAVWIGLIGAGFTAQTAAAKPRHSVQTLRGDWVGRYVYGDVDPLTAAEGVAFEAKLKPERRGRGFIGATSEPNTFGDPSAKKLFADLRGQFDPDGSLVSFLKTYNGVGGVSHSVEYRGVLRDRGARIVGTWAIGGGTGGGFVMERPRDAIS
jgi:hypothetical protein